jgi:hypothetical protein
MFDSVINARIVFFSSLGEMIGSAYKDITCLPNRGDKLIFEQEFCRFADVPHLDWRVDYVVHDFQEGIFKVYVSHRLA